MFSFISMNWRGRPLVSYRTIIELISQPPPPRAACKIKAERDWNHYDTGVQVSKAEMAALPAHHATTSMATGTTHWRLRIKRVIKIAAGP